MREVATTMPPQRAMAPPLSPVPAPRATTGTPCFSADWTMAWTWAVESGKTTASGRARSTEPSYS